MKAVVHHPNSATRVTTGLVEMREILGPE
jgi:hypothetical protein